MSSVFAQIFARFGAPALYRGLGVTGRYVAVDGTATANLAIQIEIDEAVQVDRSVKASGVMQTGKISVAQSQLAKATIGGRFSIGNDIWTVETTPTVANGQLHCKVCRVGVERLMPKRARE